MTDTPIADVLDRAASLIEPDWYVAPERALSEVFVALRQAAALAREQGK